MVNVNLLYREFDCLPVLIINSKIFDGDYVIALSSLEPISSKVNDKTFDEIYSVAKKCNRNGFLEPSRHQPYTLIPEDVMLTIKNLLIIK